MDWIYIDVNDTQIKKIGQKLMTEDLIDSGYEMQDNMIIELIPCFNSTIDIQKPIIRNEEKIETNGIKMWPDIEDPMIVMIDVSNDNIIQLWRDELIDQIGEKSIHRDMKIKPHIKLFKAGDVGEEKYFNIDRDTRDNLVERTAKFEIPNYITAKNVVRESWEDNF